MLTSFFCVEKKKKKKKNGKLIYKEKFIFLELESSP